MVPRGGGDIGTRIGVVSCSEASNVGKSENFNEILSSTEINKNLRIGNLH